MKKTVLLIVCMFFAVAFSFASAVGLSFIEDDCGQDPCVCFVQLGDEGGFVKEIIERLKAQGYLAESVPTGLFSEEVETAVIAFQRDNELPQTGTMDDDTLTLLIWGMLPEQLDKEKPIISGKPETYPDQVYIPTDGGKKRHSNSKCSKMYDPRKVSIRNAAEFGFDACGKCNKSEIHLH